MSDDFEMEVVESPSLEDGSSDEGTGQPSPSGDSSSSFLVGALPDEWDAHRLDDICQVNPESFSQDSHEADEFEYISLSDATDGVVTNTESVPVEEAPSRATRKVREGDVLVGTVRPKQSSHGFATEEHDGKVCSSGFGVLRTDGHVNSQYLRQEVLSHRFFRQMMAYVAGSGYPAVKLSDLEKHRIALPPLPEQRKIASVLYAVDQAIQKTEAIIEQAKRVRRGVIQDIFRVGLDKNKNLRRPEENPEHFRESRHGRTPKSWEIQPLDALVPESAPITYGIVKPGDHHPGGVPVVKVKDIVEGEIKEEELLHTDPEIHQKYDRAELKEGDLLFSIRGTVGRMAFVPTQLEGGNITQDTARIRPDNVDSTYLRYYLETDIARTYFKRHKIGQAVQGINLEALREAPVLLPPRKEQEMIVSVIKSYSDLIQKELAGLTELRRLKKGLMQDLLTGEVRTMDKAIEVLGEVNAHG